MNLLLAGAAGIVLAASAGLRAFMPLLGAGLAARFLDWPLAASMEWLSSDVALVGLGIATVLELAADKVPVLDHLLDAVHTVSGPLAGVLVTFAALGQLPPALGILLAIALGAPVAGGVHAISAATRLKSTVMSGGTLNPAVSVAEDGLSVGAILVAVLAPLLAALVAIVLLLLVGQVMMRLFRRRAVTGG